MKRKSNGSTLEAFFSSKGEKKMNKYSLSSEKQLRSLLLSRWVQSGVHACEEFVVPFELTLCEKIKKRFILPCDYEWWNASVLFAKMDERQRFLVDQQLVKKEKHIVLIEIDRFEHSSYQKTAETFRILYICGYLLIKEYATIVDVYRINPDKYSSGTTEYNLPLVERVESAVEAFFGYPSSTSKKIRFFYFYFSFRYRSLVPAQVEDALQSLRARFELSWNNCAWTFSHNFFLRNCATSMPDRIQPRERKENKQPKTKIKPKSLKLCSSNQNEKFPKSLKNLKPKKRISIDEIFHQEVAEEIFSKKDVKLREEKHRAQMAARQREEQSLIKDFTEKLERLKYQSGGSVLLNGNYYRFQWRRPKTNSSKGIPAAINLKTKDKTVAKKLGEKLLKICKNIQ